MLKMGGMSSGYETLRRTQTAKIRIDLMEGGEGADDDGEARGWDWEEAYEVHHDLAQTHILQRRQRSIIILPREPFKGLEEVGVSIIITMTSRDIISFSVFTSMITSIGIRARWSDVAYPVL